MGLSNNGMATLGRDMKGFYRLLFIVALLGLGGCATPRIDHAQRFHESAVSRPGFAALYIYRPHHKIGAGVWPEMFINDQKVVGLENKGYTVIFVRPSKYRIRTEKSNFMSGMDNIPGEFEIESEGTYFLKFDRSYNQSTSYVVANGGMYASPSFTTNYERWVLVPRSMAISEISDCYFVPPYRDSVTP